MYIQHKTATRDKVLAVELLSMEMWAEAEDGVVSLRSLTRLGDL